MKDRYTGILSLSDRAIKAKEDGLLTFSQLKAWQKRAAAQGAVRPREWHHTSAAANCTDFYDPADFAGLDPADYPPAKAEKSAQADLTRLRITITYERLTSGFSQRARKHYETVTATGLDVRKSDNKIIGAGGRRLNSNNVEAVFEYRAPRSRAWKRITKAEAKGLGYVFA